MPTIITTEEKNGRPVMVFETDPPRNLARVFVPKGYLLTEGKRGYTLAAEDGEWSVSGTDAAIISIILDSKDGDLDAVRDAMSKVHENALTAAILLPPGYSIWTAENGTVTLNHEGRVIYYGRPEGLEDALFENA